MVISVFYIFELIGTVAFAISGSMLAIDKRADLFGVLFLGFTTAVGGGIVRDLFLGNIPPKAFTNEIFIIVALFVSLVLFLSVKILKGKYLEKTVMVENINNVFDALGLGAFTVTGMQLAIAAGHGENMLYVLFLGVATGVGGGLIRDVMVKEIPFILRKRIYALASISGGIVYYLLYFNNVNQTVSAVCAISVVFGLRMMATIFKWSLPKAL
ncbi:MAG: trimeric intracellular cation channel family protein [bacterium]|nr:trimeric intracellular cation channel family protein [bacterium]